MLSRGGAFDGHRGVQMRRRVDRDDVYGRVGQQPGIVPVYARVGRGAGGGAFLVDVGDGNEPHLAHFLKRGAAKFPKAARANQPDSQRLRHSPAAFLTVR